MKCFNLADIENLKGLIRVDDIYISADPNNLQDYISNFNIKNVVYIKGSQDESLQSSLKKNGNYL